MQAVGDLDEYHSYVLAHGEQELLEVLGLFRCVCAENASCNFSETVHYVGYLVAEKVSYVLYCVIGIFYNVVQECSANGC